MRNTLRSRRTVIGRIALLAVGLLSPLVALAATQPIASTAGKSWNAPVLNVAGGTTTTVAPGGKSWN